MQNPTREPKAREQADVLFTQKALMELYERIDEERASSADAKEEPHDHAARE